MALIGITNCRKLEDYRQAVLHVGGEVRVLESSTDVAEALDGLDGLLLTGGGDVAPARYGEAPHADRRRGRAGPRRVRDRAGRAARGARPADPRDLPRHPGAERRLRRHARAGHPVAGRRRARAQLAVPPHQSFELAHEIWIDKDSLLARLMRERLSDADSCDVNSRHHQAVKQVAPGFSVSATAPDGVIEAIEDPAAALLPRRPVAPGELLAHRRIPAAVRRLSRSGQLVVARRR